MIAFVIFGLMLDFHSDDDEEEEEEILSFFGGSALPRVAAASLTLFAREQWQLRHFSPLSDRRRTAIAERADCTNFRLRVLEVPQPA